MKLATGRIFMVTEEELMMKQAFVSLFALMLLSQPGIAADNGKPAGPLDKFNGIGRMQDFRAAMPDERRGWELLRDRHPEKAAERFQAAINTYANLPLAYLGLGVANERLNNLDAALTAYRGAIKCDTNNWRAWKRLGNLLYQQDKFTEARDALANAVALHPPAKARQQIDKMIQAVEAAKKNGHADRTQMPDTGEEPD
jgi:tetratricopeptide (TPR) repeat protein